MGSATAAAPTTAQINVRINRELKASGDRVLEAYGVSPTEFIRGLWTKLAQGGKEAEACLAAGGLIKEDSQQEVAQRMEPVHRLFHSFDEFAEEWGVDLTLIPPLSDEELEEAMWKERHERWAERGVA